MERDVCLIVNPSAGGGRSSRLLPAVEAALARLGVRFRVQRTASLEHGRALARETLQTGEVAAAMGGDGLLGAVAGELRDSDGVLGVLPAGRGNDFARKLGIGPGLARACATLATAGERRVDVADVGGRACLGIASAGFDSAVQDVVVSTRWRLGRSVYLYGTLRALRTWRPARWEVVLDGAAQSFSGYSVAVANSGVYGGGMRLAPDAELADGRLDVVFTEERSRIGFLATLPRVFNGSHVGTKGLHIHPAREVAFDADRPFTVYADGDPIAELPCTVSVQPRALRVLAPA